MKYILLGALLIMSIFANGQTSTTDKAITTASGIVDSAKQGVKNAVTAIDTSSNFRRIYDDVKTGVSALASSLKVGSEHVYKVLVRQQIANSIANLLLILLMFILAIVFYRLSRKTFQAHIELYQKRNNSWNADLDDTAKGPVAVLLGIACGISVCIGVIVLCHEYGSIIMGFINPEYGAIKDIIDIVRAAR